ncbi:single-stranded DNA-binding protein [Caenibacillus caldisaponilyticus]|uniref:single-stranded DNA-binding protein n=1 Tax=Caenibacillus caldisaponilyticus TaxID=1674942 RepID=UPI0009884203|nr:single-stranded DNA-binding protein [Caenibacillus caldisaponilyticus]
MINRVILIGRLTKDPDLRYTPNGNAVATFTLAVNRPFTNQEGEREADFIQVIAWRKLGENAANYLSKGRLAGVDGRLQTRNYEKDGRRVYVTEVVAESVQFLDPKGARSDQPARNELSENDDPFAGDGDPFADDGKPIDIADDDLPF